jgi:hypothetical protein
MQRRDFLKVAPGALIAASEIGKSLPASESSVSTVSAVVWTTERGQLHEVGRAAVSRNARTQMGDWSVRTTTKMVAGGFDARDIEATFSLDKGTAKSVAVGVEIGLPNWSTGNFVLFPGSVYAGNRFTCVPIKYSETISPSYVRQDAPIYIRDIARLSTGPGPSFIERLIGDMSTPAVGFVAPDRNEGLLLLTTQGCRLGDYGLALEESEDRTHAWIRLTAPGVRRLRQILAATGSVFNAGMVPSEDHGADWKAGDEVTVCLRLHRFPAHRPQDLFDRLAATRKSVTGPDQPRHVLPFSQAWEMLETRFNRDIWNESLNAYAGGLPWIYMDEHPFDDHSAVEFGWTGGGIATQALLFDGTSLSRSRARRNLETILTGAAAPSGLFNTIFESGHWRADQDLGNWKALLPRNQGDGLFCVMKQLNLLHTQGEPIPPQWENAVRQQADALVHTWQHAGQFGFAIDSLTGDVVWGGSTSGALIPAGLARASEWFQSPEYLSAAIEAAEFYAHHDLAAGITSGGPGDALQAPDSESSYGLLQTFLTLWEVTQEARWLEYARQMGRQFASWVVSYDFRFPASSTFARADIRATGAVWANAQNIVPPPSICCASGDALFRIFRATGDPFYLDLVRDIAHGIPQYFSREDRPLRCGHEGRTMPPSWVWERVQTSDWESPDVPLGEWPCALADWVSNAMMLSWIELPGIYVQPDAALVYAIDHVNARLLHQTPGAVVAELHNPTMFSARVRVFAETHAAARVPLPLNALLKRPVVMVPAGGRLNVRAESDGKATVV